MEGTKKTQRIMLGIAFVIVLTGFGLVVAEMYKTMEPIYLFGKFNLGIVLIIVGGIVTFFAPKPGRKKKGYRF